MVNSRNKGARGEREFSQVCREHGFEDSRRGQQFSGIEGEDVVGLPGIHVEVKRVETLNIDKAMDQSIRDAGEDQIPMVAHRKNRRQWLITMPADKWFELYKKSLQFDALKEDAFGKHWQDCNTCLHEEGEDDYGDIKCKTPICNGVLWQWRGLEGRNRG